MTDPQSGSAHHGGETYIDIEHLDADLVEQLYPLTRVDMMAWAWLAVLFDGDSSQRTVPEVRALLVLSLADTEAAVAALGGGKQAHQVAYSSPERQRVSRSRALRFLDDQLTPAAG